MDLVEKNVIVLGAGSSGVAVSRLLVARGACVWLVDEGEPDMSEETRSELGSLGITVEFSAVAIEPIGWEFAVLSPGISEESWLRRELDRLNVPPLGEIEVASRLASGDVVAVTGTNGKTTTTRLIDSIMREVGWKTLSAGNIGYPYSLAVLQEPQPEWVSLEVSSFQLESIEAFRPRVSVLLNLAPDHLDRHGSCELYYRTKARIFENQDQEDWCVIQKEAARELEERGHTIKARVLTFSSEETSADLYFGNGFLVSQIPGWSGVLFDCSCGRLVGRHNAENMMAAILVGYALGLPLSEIRTALENFRPDSHRLERLPTIGGVVVVNDSKATNPHALAAAVEAMSPLVGAKGRLWLIAGGESKQLPFHGLASLVGKKVEGAFLFGRSRDEIGAALGKSTPCFLKETLQESVDAAFQRSQSGDVILFSPGCASFDQFNNYAHRGDTFKASVAACQAAITRSGRRLNFLKDSAERQAAEPSREIITN